VMRPNAERDAEIAELADAGWTAARLAERFGLSRQRVRTVLRAERFRRRMIEGHREYHEAMERRDG
jgi:lambda repressor-like predicted transcriptional regulator